MALQGPLARGNSNCNAFLQGVLDFKGGEAAALARLKYYLWDSDLIATYFDTRNGMVGELAGVRRWCERVSLWEQLLVGPGLCGLRGGIQHSPA